MKKLFTALLGSAALLAGAVHADDGVVRVLDGSRDGDVTYYTVMCKNGNNGTVTVIDTPPQACAQSLGRDRKCNAKWTLREAAAEACK